MEPTAAAIIGDHLILDVHHLLADLLVLRQLHLRDSVVRQRWG